MTLVFLRRFNGSRNHDENSGTTTPYILTTSQTWPGQRSTQG